MTVALRILTLLLSLFVTGTLSVSARAGVRPETRVGGSPHFSSVFASAASSQAAEPHQENPGCVYDFAPAVHKYLYCHDYPVNNTDPSGHESLDTQSVTHLGIGTMARTMLPAVGRGFVRSRQMIGRSMVQAARLRVGDPMEYLAGRGVGALASLTTVATGLGLGLAFEDSDETRGRILYRGMQGQTMPDLLPEGDDKSNFYLGIRSIDIKNVQNGMVMPSTQGLSVTPSNPLLMHHIPLGKILQGEADLWGIYEGLLDLRLMVRPDPKNLMGHALIGVAAPMPVAEFKRLIAETQRMWSKLPMPNR